MIVNSFGLMCRCKKKEIIFPTSFDLWKKFESNNESTALNVLYVPYKTKEIRHAYKSKYNLKRENQVIILMITYDEKWHYLAVKSLSELLRGIIGNNNGDFEKHKNVSKNHDYCYVEMPEEDNRILKYNHGEKSMTAPFVIYSDLEYLLEKISTCHNNP